MATNGGLPLVTLFCLLLAFTSVIAKHHHKSRVETASPSEVENGEEAPSGYCSKTDQKVWTNGWANTTMDIQYTKTVKIESSKDGKLRDGTRKVRERYRRSAAKETPAEKKKRKRKNKKARKDKKQKQQKVETTTQQPKF